MSMIDLDALLDGGLANVEAAPEFITPDTGDYHLALVDLKVDTIEVKDATKRAERASRGESNTIHKIRVTHQVINTLLLEDESKRPPKPMSLVSEDFNLDEKGLSFYKARMADILEANGVAAESLDEGSLREQLETLPQAGFVYYAHIKSTTRTMDDGREFDNIRISQIRAVEEQ